MHTGYFGKVKFYPKDKGLWFVSIARFAKFWEGERYIKLAPPPELLQIKDKEEYINLYQEQVLYKLDPQKVYQELGSNAVLLCYEKYDDCKNGIKFCHRHMIAKWLEKKY